MTVRATAKIIARTPATCILSGARVALDPLRAIRATLLLRNGKVEAILPGREAPAGLDKSLPVMNLKDHLILPGLINTHDHLHFGLFPRLGSGPYSSWREWAEDIHHPDEPPLLDLLKIPKETRLWRGAIHNALAGVTTVCHHDAPHDLLTSNALPVEVYTDFGWAHSLDDRQWARRYAQTPANQPFILHFAEGTDAQSRRETARLERKVEFNERLVLVHAIGVTEQDWLKLCAAGVWIIWCPTSNLHILGHTLARDLLLSYPSIALGSDSPVSAAGDLLDELQSARALLDLPSDLLYQMVTTRAARLMRLSGDQGTIVVGGVADFLIVRDHGKSPCDSLAALSRRDIAAVMRGGEITVASEEFYILNYLVTEHRLFTFQRHGMQWYVSAPPHVLTLQSSKTDSKPFSPLAEELTNQ
jgi:cytosine/adenosine deaminase-related metal-dependent hydrolase